MPIFGALKPTAPPWLAGWREVPFSPYSLGILGIKTLNA
jgi:hypothetical protein